MRASVTDPVPTITVIAGTNGAGKSSILGEFLRQHGGEYFNPDDMARRLRKEDPDLTQYEANAQAWLIGKEGLEDAIYTGRDYTFETTLGGNTIKRLLHQAAAHGHRLVIWYVGLASAEAHIERVTQRVRRGGHPIPEDKIRERFEQSVQHLIELLPAIFECRLFDNSESADLCAGEAPAPVSLLHIRDREIVSSVALSEVPEWAKPVFAAVLAREKSRS